MSDQTMETTSAEEKTLQRPFWPGAWQSTDPPGWLSGVATDFWLELMQLQPWTARSLWLRVGGKDWAYLNGPSEEIQRCVQDAFANPDHFEVKVWYQKDGKGKYFISGLVVNSKSKEELS